MEKPEQVSRGIFALPNEILLDVFNEFPTKSLLQLTPTCRHFHSLILRLIHNRLQVASELEGSGTKLYLACQHPSVQRTVKKIYCHATETEGLQELQSAVFDEINYVGQVKSIFGLYSRFRPQLQEPGFRKNCWQPAVETTNPGTVSSSDPASPVRKADDVVSRTVTVDAHELFSQLETHAYLGKREPKRGLLTSMFQMSKGQIRVWRNFLADQCESKSWTDGESVVVHHDPPTSPVDKGEARHDSFIGNVHPTKDPSILWLNTGDNNLGLKLRVKEQQWRRNNPAFLSSEIEAAVSYEVDFEEILIRTTHLLTKLEEAQKQEEDQTGKAIVFGVFRGPDNSQ